MGRRRIIGLGTLRLTRAPNENPKRLRAAAAPLPKAAANIAKFPEGPQFPPVHLHRRIQVAQQRGDTPHLFALLGVANVSFGSLAAAARSQWDVRFSNRPFGVKRFLTEYPPPLCRCRSRARASLRNRHQGPSIMGFEDEAEQSIGRPCRQTNGRSKRPNELTSSIVPRGTSFHRSVELELPPIAFNPH